MLYHLYDLQHALLSPLRLTAEALQQTFSNPFLPIAYTRFGRTIAAGSEVIERATRRYGKPKFGLTETPIGSERVPVRATVLDSTAFCDLLHFRRAGERVDPKVLVVAPMSGHYATLLRGTVSGLLPDHDVYITDWANAATVPAGQGRFDLDDYIDTVVRFIEKLGPDVHVIAVCQPSPPVLAAVALLSAADPRMAPRSMILMGGPVDTRVNPTEVNRLAARQPLDWFERTVITDVPAAYPGYRRRVYPGFLQLSGFMSMNLDRHVGSAIRHYQHLVRGDGDGAAAHRAFYDEYLSVMDLTAEFFLQTVKTVFQDHALAQGTMLSRGRKIEPAAIAATALMTVEGELDDISGIGQTYAAHALCSALPADKRDHLVQPGVGHFGIFNGRRWREAILPRVRAFIRNNA